MINRIKKSESDKPNKNFVCILMLFILYFSFTDITGTLGKVFAKNTHDPGSSINGATFLNQTESFFEHLIKLPDFKSQKITESWKNQTNS